MIVFIECTGGNTAFADIKPHASPYTARLHQCTSLASHIAVTTVVSSAAYPLMSACYCTEHDREVRLVRLEIAIQCLLPVHFWEPMSKNLL